MISLRAPRIARLSALVALAALGVVVDGPVGAAPAPASAAVPATYQIVGGEMHYEMSATQSCTFPVGGCTGTPDGDRTTSFQFTTSSDVTMTVHAPGDPAPTDPEAEVFAALKTEPGWSYTWDWTRNDVSNVCGGATTNRQWHDNFAPDPMIPSSFNAAMVITPAETEVGFTIAPIMTEPTEPQYGWELPIALRYSDSDHYPTVTSHSSVASAECNGSSQTDDMALTPDHTFNPYPAGSFGAGGTRTPYHGTRLYTPLGCNNDGCLTRVSGSDGFIYSGVNGGDSLTGGVDITWEFDIVSNLQCEPATSPTVEDTDGDRLPDDYELNISTTHVDDPDSDNDCYSDSIEVASGSSPLNNSQTPDTLPKGGPAASISGSGHAGITCGRTTFKWFSPALQPLGVPSGKKGCILLLSNANANAVLDYAIATDKATITSTLANFSGTHIGEVMNDQTVDWSHELQVDLAIAAGKLAAKKMLYRAFNFTRLNLFFVSGEMAGLGGVAYGTFWALNQIRNNNACMQVRIGRGADNWPHLSWSLVYNKQALTDAGLKDGLHKAGVWKKKVQLGPDTAVRKFINLQCSGGKAVATGGGASQVFDGARSAVY